MKLDLVGVVVVTQAAGVPDDLAHALGRALQVVEVDVDGDRPAVGLAVEQEADRPQH